MTFAAALETFGERTAILLPDGATLSYVELASRADDAVGTLRASYPDRRPVVIECANTLPSVLAYLGALRRRIPALLVEHKLDSALKQRLYAHFRFPEIWTVDGKRLVTGHDAPSVSAKVAVMLSTSGSTGAPKLVRLSETNLQANALSISEYLSLDETERAITSLPIHYSYGLSVLNSHLTVGASLILTDEPVTSRAFWSQCRDMSATSIAGVPATYRLLRQLRFERMTLPALRTMTQAGGRLPLDLVAWASELAVARGQRFFVMYGQTEATARMAYIPPQHLPEKAGAIGVPIPGTAIHLIDENGKRINAPDVVGEIVFSGPNVMLGYAQEAADLAKGDQLGGVLHTGDLAKCDADGFYFIVGRLSRFIKIFGKRYGLDELEGQLRDQDFDVAVTGRDDLLAVALRDGTQAQADELRDFLCTRYQLHHSTVRVVTLPTLPTSSSGKVQYAKLLEIIAPEVQPDGSISEARRPTIR